MMGLNTVVVAGAVSDAQEQVWGCGTHPEMCPVMALSKGESDGALRRTPGYTQLEYIHLL